MPERSQVSLATQPPKRPLWACVALAVHCPSAGAKRDTWRSGALRARHWWRRFWYNTPMVNFRYESLAYKVLPIIMAMLLPSISLAQRITTDGIPIKGDRLVAYSFECDVETNGWLVLECTSSTNRVSLWQSATNDVAFVCSNKIESVSNRSASFYVYGENRSRSYQLVM